MLVSNIVAIFVALAPLASGHGGNALPKVVGLDRLDRRIERMIHNIGSRELLEVGTHDETILRTRKDDRECGEGIGSCPNDKCCSSIGYCGSTPDHCYSPGCDYKFGPACPENQYPEGANTSSIPRPKIGSVPYGGIGVSKCRSPGMVALTYDDGPLKGFTARILDLLKSYDAKATFFVTGNNINKGQIDKTQEHIDAIKRMDVEGHQIASHTWTHLNLSKISSEDRKHQIWNLEMALNNIVGKVPTYMRPPYVSCQAACQQDMSDLGYHIIYYDVDTDDYQQIGASNIQNSKDWFKGNITKGGATPETHDWLAISHDIVEQTANNLTEYMLSTLTQLGYKAVTVGECLGDPEDNWYRRFGDSADPTGDSSTSTKSSSSETASSASSTGTIPASTNTISNIAPEQTTSFADTLFDNTAYYCYRALALLLVGSIVVN